MIHLVLGTFRAAGLTNFGAKLADAICEFRATGHFAHRERADISAAPVEFDATDHHLHIFLVQAGRSAVFAGFHALMTRLDAGFVFLVGHVF